ncbi:GDSL-like Lipase/Acylhydrolase [Anatilimnocola aggregata]|uniref:GDSL-like Lipase/Acylhydrolase n=1 Tax=Anatilimnocola aggregata TaxID=2528021 RepID=A0A517Y4A5_9BACT|nr:SGNH/GDSL hydrolase family protein [Anatilimnocola aggregata]QDU24962.1 GDSL-like Lipase/Acylhydrolase [Anatilimnocola aggregata]
MKRFPSVVLLALSIACSSAFAAKPKANDAVATDSTLPNVLILGDSISIGYTPVVRDALKSKANVIRPSANCGETRMGLAGIDDWLGDGKWDVIHFNWGLWDLCYRNPDSKTQGNRDKVNGKQAIPLAEYEANLERLVERLKQTGAVLVWASTTVVPEGEAGRVVGDELKYNAAAERVMKKHGVRIDDLHSLTKRFEPELFTKPGDVHYTPAGYGKIGSQAAAAIEAALKK